MSTDNEDRAREAENKAREARYRAEEAEDVAREAARAVAADRIPDQEVRKDTSEDIERRRSAGSGDTSVSHNEPAASHQTPAAFQKPPAPVAEAPAVSDEEQARLAKGKQPPTKS